MSWETYGQLDVLFRLVGVIGVCLIFLYWVIRILLDDRKSKRGDTK